MTPKEAYAIEKETTEALSQLADAIGFARADLAFSEAGLNSDYTWETKSIEAMELVREYEVQHE